MPVITAADLMMQQVTIAEYERQARLRKAWEYYHGQMKRPLKVLPGGKDDNVCLNYCRLFVDKSVAYLLGQETQLDIDGGEKGTNVAADAWFTEWWEYNGGVTNWQKAAVNGGVTGHTFVKMRPPGPGERYPRAIVLDPQNVTPVCDPEDYEQIVRYIVQWHGVDPSTGQPMARKQVIERNELGRWTITDFVARGTDRGWVLLNGPDVWPFEWCPISECQNLLLPNVFWGMSDLETDVLESNDAVNFVVSNTARILRFHAHPKTWGSGFRAAELEVSADEVISFPNPDAKLQNLEMASDLSSSLDFLRELKQALHELGRVPEIATGKVENLGSLSGVALRILEGPLMELTMDKRTRYGRLMQEVALHALEMGGYGPKHEVEIHWQNPLPVDDQAEASAAQTWEQVGVSKDTLLTRAGFDAQEEATKRGAEADEAMARAQANANVMARMFNRGVVGQ